MQTFIEINASLQKLLSGNEKCDEDEDAHNDEADKQHDPYVSAMLRRQHKKQKHLNLLPFLTSEAKESMQFFKGIQSNFFPLQNYLLPLKQFFMLSFLNKTFIIQILETLTYILQIHLS